MEVGVGPEGEAGAAQGEGVGVGAGGDIQDRTPGAGLPIFLIPPSD